MEFGKPGIGFAKFFEVGNGGQGQGDVGVNQLLTAGENIPTSFLPTGAIVDKKTGLE